MLVSSFTVTKILLIQDDQSYVPLQCSFFLNDYLNHLMFYLLIFFHFLVCLVKQSGEFKEILISPDKLHRIYLCQTRIFEFTEFVE